MKHRMKHRMKNRMRTGKCRGWADFSLLGLIIVVAVILVLVLVMIPVVRKALSKGQIVKCQNNLSTLGTLKNSINDPKKLPRDDALCENYWIRLVFRNQFDAPGTLICPATADRTGDWKGLKTAPAYDPSAPNASYMGPVDKKSFYKVQNAGSSEVVSGDHWTNHRTGVNILFGDAHVDFFKWEDLEMTEEDRGNIAGFSFADTAAKIDLTFIGTLRPDPPAELATDPSE